MLTSILALAVALVVASGRLVEIPAVLGGGSSRMPVSALVPLVVVVTLAQSLSSRERQLERAAPRRVGLWDASYMCVALLVTAVLCWVASSFGVTNVAWVLRNTVALVGIVAIVTACGGAALGSLAAGTIVVATSSYGPLNTGARFVRIFQQDPHDASYPTVVAGVLLCLGLALMATSGRARRTSYLRRPRGTLG